MCIVVVDIHQVQRETQLDTVQMNNLKKFHESYHSRPELMVSDSVITVTLFVAH